MPTFVKGCKCKYRGVAIVGDGIHTRKELHAIATASVEDLIDEPLKKAIKKSTAKKKATKKKTKK